MANEGPENLENLKRRITNQIPNRGFLVGKGPDRNLASDESHSTAITPVCVTREWHG